MYQVSFTWVAYFLVLLCISSLCVSSQSTAWAAKPTGKLASFGVKRTWEDSAGTFQIDAKLIEADASSVRLERSDSKVTVVPLEKLSKKDQEFIRDFLKADELEQANQEKKKSFRPIPVGQYELSASKPLELSLYRSQWRASDVTPMNLAPGIDMAADIQLPPGNGFQLFAAGGKPTVYLNAYRTSEDRTGTTFSLLGKIRFPDGSPTIIADSATPWRILALTPDGKKFAALNSLDRASFVSFWESTSEGVAPLFQFEVGVKPNVRALFSPIDVASACFLNSNQLLTLSPTGEIHSWSIKPKTVIHVATVPGAKQIKIGGNGDLVAISSPGKVVLLNGALKEQMGLIVTDCVGFSSIAFSPNGKYLAVNTPFSVRIYRLADGSIHSSIPVPTQDSKLPLDWAGDYCLLNKQLLLDIVGKRPIWKYTAPDDAIPEMTSNFGLQYWKNRTGEGTQESRAVRNGPIWDVYARVGPSREQAHQEEIRNPRQAVWAGQIFTMFRNQTTSIVATTIPHDDALEATKSIDVDAMIALKPGCSMQIEAKLDQVKEQDKALAIDGLTSSFKRKNWIVEHSENRAIITAQKMPSQKITLYFDQPQEVVYSPVRYTIAFQVGGQQVFECSEEVHIRGTTLPNESAQQFADRVTQFNPSYFANVPLPNQIMWPKYQWGIGETTIESSAKLTSKWNEDTQLPQQPTRRRRN